MLRAPANRTSIARASLSRWLCLPRDLRGVKEIIFEYQKVICIIKSIRELPGILCRRRKFGRIYRRFWFALLRFAAFAI
jgi:hypothetical protein